MQTIAIVNRTNLKNFGSVLQVYALCEAIKRLGYHSEVVWQSGNMSKNQDIRPVKVIRTLLRLCSHPLLLWSTVKAIIDAKSQVIDELKEKKFNDFVDANFVQSFYDPEEITKMAATDKFYKFVCGSDQIWSSTTLYPDPMMYLRFAPKGKRVAYAPSLGRNYIPNYNKKILKKYISDVPCLSVREDEGRRLIKELTGRDALVVADPTLLLSSRDWDSLKIEIETPGNYVLCYFLDTPSDDVKTNICKYASLSGRDIVVLGKLNNLNYPQNKIHFPVAGPGEFLHLISNASMVITDSYHGMLFAINYRKKFWSVERAYSQYDQSSRQLTVLSRLDLKERYLKKDFNFSDANIDYVSVRTKIEDFVTESMDYLKQSLE